MTGTGLLYPREALKAWLRSRGQADDDNSMHPLGELLDIVFYASLESEEGIPTRVRIVYHEHGIEGLERAHEQRFVGDLQGTMPAWQILPFERDAHVTALTTEALVKIAPAASLPRTAVVVAMRDGKLVIDGLARRVERTYFRTEGEDRAFMLSAQRPGRLVLFHHGEEVFRFERGRSVPRRPGALELFEEKAGLVQAGLRALCAKIISESPRPNPFESDCFHIVSHALTDIIEVMSRGVHGGLVALLPASSDSNMAAAGKYRLTPSQRRALPAMIAHLAECSAHSWNLAQQRTTSRASGTAGEERESMMAQADEVKAKADLGAFVESIGQLSTIDNALLLGPDLEVLCAGFPIGASATSPEVYEVATIQGDRGALYPMLRHGSRHRAAATFAYTFAGGLAFLCSQDGDLRCMYRPVDKDYVLLWNLSPSEP